MTGRSTRSGTLWPSRNLRCSAISTVSETPNHSASYLGLVPSTRQSADHCYYGHITNAGSTQTLCMLTQGVQRNAAYFRRLCKRKNRNVAISAVARKLVTI